MKTRLTKNEAATAHEFLDICFEPSFGWLDKSDEAFKEDAKTARKLAALGLIKLGGDSDGLAYWFTPAGFDFQTKGQTLDNPLGIVGDPSEREFTSAVKAVRAAQALARKTGKAQRVGQWYEGEVLAADEDTVMFEVTKNGCR